MNKLQKQTPIAAVALILALLTTAAAVAQADNRAPEKKKETQLLLPEGVIVSGREATLVRHPSRPRWFLQFNTSESTAAADTADPFAVPLEVLPGKWLTNMVRFCGQQENQSARFRVWGEITTYQKRNYIIPTFAAALSVFGPDPGVDQTKADDNSLETVKLRQAIMALPRTRPLLSSDETTPDSLTSAPPKPPSRTSGTEGICRDGYMVIDRVGRLTYYPDAQQWLFAFEADAASLAEPPVEVLPSQLLEVMEKLQRKSSRALRFRISGQVTKYQNRNYILLRKVLVVYDSGNLGG